MAPNPTEGNPTEGSIVAVQNESNCKNYICVFTDETNNNSKFHQNVSGDTILKSLYEIVAEKLHYEQEAFNLCYLDRNDLNNEEVALGMHCDESLYELLKNSTSKMQNFKIKLKEKNSISRNSSNEPTTQAIEEATESSESYSTDFFNLEGNKEEATIGPSYAETIKMHTFKSGTGYVGLVNQAMTCYLNSLLQTLYMTPEFRNGLYRWRFKGTSKEETTSIPFQLQKLFLKLQTSNKRAVETTGLTKSFGWESGEAWQQHDVQELCRVMFDKLEETLKNTDQEHLINQLYQGEMKDYVKCLKCGHENSRDDNYLDISVEIRPFGSKEPHKNLEDALKAFVTPETLDSNNQYFCEKCNSKQDAHKGLKFLSFPYLLTIQLKRFTFDYDTLQRIKLPDKLMFPFQIDLTNLADQSKEEEKTVNGNIEKCECPDNDRKYSADEKIIHDEKIVDSIPHENLPSADQSKGPYKYELFSILIHSGSAIGGHYYVYIKSFEDNKWYCFNDQYVTEISEEEIKKSYGGNDKIGSVFTSNFSSSTNAYMLMYRQIKPSQNKGFMKQSEWSESLEDLCKSFLQEDHREQNRKEYEKNICKLNLYATHPVTKVKVDAKLEVHKDKTLTEATKIAWQLLELEKVIPLSQCRLVKYDDYNSSFDRSYEGCDEKPMIELLGAVRSTYGFDLLLECREEHETFSIYLQGGTTLKVYVVDLEETDFDEPITFHVPLTYTVGELKLFLKQKLYLSAETMRIAVCKDYHDFYLLGKETRTLKNEGLQKSAKLFVEASSQEDRKVNFKDSQFYHRLDVFKHSINIQVVLPFLQEGSKEEKKVMKMLIDKRITLNDLKEKISSHINLCPEEFRLYRTYSNNQEFECTRLNEQLSAYSNETKVIVKLGRALKAGETRIKIHQLFIYEKEHFKFLMEGIVSNKMTVKQLKEEQIIPEFEKQEINVPLNRCRLRKNNYKNPSHIYPDHYSFEEDSLRYANEFFVEVLDHDDEFGSLEDTSIYIRRWHPDTYVLDAFEEIILHKKTTVIEFKQEIEKKSDIPLEFVSIAKGRSGSFPFKYSVLDLHQDLEWDSVCHYVTDFPLALRDDGLVVYYRDSRETLKKLTEEEKSKIRKQEREKSPEVSIAKNYRKEKPLKIYTNGEKR